MQHYPGIPYLCRLAFTAGAIIQENFCLGMAREMKEDDTPLTVTDKVINQLVINSIRANYPHIRVIGEEGDYEVEDAEYTVLCDPVDGTIPFCRGIPLSTFVISVLKAHQPLAAVIYDPFMDRMWHAEHGWGAFLTVGGKMNPIQVSSHDTLRHSNMCMVWWGGSSFKLHAAAEKLMNAGVTIANPNTIAYYGGLLASGEQDATIFPGLKGWETAAMSLIAEEAGGRATDIHGNPLRYGSKGEIEGHIISNGVLHDELVELVASCQ